MNSNCSDLTRQFESHEIDASVFGHREHLLVAYEILQRYSFVDASARYLNAINTIATNAGAPEKFHVTITMAFLSIIAARLHSTEHSNFEEFIANNEDLMSKAVLRNWYSESQLNSDFARTHFLLPDRAA